LRWGFIGIVSSAFFLQEPILAEENPQSILQQALQAEALREYPEAVRGYEQVLRLAPENPIARTRIIAIFKALTEQGQSTEHLVLLVSPDVLDELRSLGYVKNIKQEADWLKKLTVIFWSVLATAVVMIVGFVIYTFRKSRNQDDEGVFSTNKRLSAFRRANLENSKEAFSKRESVITDKTRQEITSVISGVKSITGVQPRPPDFQSLAEAEDFENSGVVTALAETMISNVSSEQTDQGKFSKMSLDASLVFDENDLPPDLEEWKEKHGEEGIEEYLNRLQDKEADKDSK